MDNIHLENQITAIYREFGYCISYHLYMYMYWSANVRYRVETYSGQCNNLKIVLGHAANLDMQICIEQDAV